MSLEYRLDKEEDGSWDLVVNSFGIARIYFKTETCASPLSDEEAKEIAEAVKCMVESKHPASELKEEDYRSKLSEFIKFLEGINELMED